MYFSCDDFERSYNQSLCFSSDDFEDCTDQCLIYLACSVWKWTECSVCWLFLICLWVFVTELLWICTGKCLIYGCDFFFLFAQRHWGIIFMVSITVMATLSTGHHRSLLSSKASLLRSRLLLCCVDAVMFGFFYHCFIWFCNCIDQTKEQWIEWLRHCSLHSSVMTFVYM